MAFKEDALISNKKGVRYAKNPTLPTPLAGIVGAEFPDRF
jgi:hypothetical protein